MKSQIMQNQLLNVLGFLNYIATRYGCFLTGNSFENLVFSEDSRLLLCVQAQSITASLSGRNVVVATMTSSGKSLCYNLPVLEALSQNLLSCALYLFPTKVCSLLYTISHCVLLYSIEFFC